MRNVSNVVERIKTHILLSMTLLFSFENRAVYEIMWKTIVDLGRAHDDITHAHCIPKVTKTHSENVTLVAFPQQQWLHERASVLRYTHIACLVITKMGCVYCTVRIGSSKLYRSRSPWFYSVLQQRLRWYPKSTLLCMLLMPPPPRQINLRMQPSWYKNFVIILP
jgi:hypothetical protein